MAGDWIKFEVTTPDKPEVIRMSSILGICNDSVTGKALRIWCWADANTVTGESVAVTEAFIDRIAFCPGFASALRQVGWLKGEDLALIFPNFSRHNGKSAKQRALTAKRVSDHRCNATAVTDVTLEPLVLALPEKRREEKRRESDICPNSSNELSLEIEPTPTPKQDTSDFDVFWKEYPNKKGKAEANRSWIKMKPDLQTILTAIAWQKKSPQWTEKAGQYIPMPATYLNNRRWEDEQPVIRPPSNIYKGPSCL